MDKNDLHFTFVHAEDRHVSSLAEMNQRLIRDEGHRNKMSLDELEQRMRQWLQGNYKAVLFELDASPVGYAIYRQESEYVYLRQFFVESLHRRKGIGTLAVKWLVENVWQGGRIRLDVLVKNEKGAAFWRAVGFEDYCLTLELKGTGVNR